MEFGALVTNWMLCKRVNLNFNRVIIVQVIFKTKEVSLISEHGVFLNRVYFGTPNTVYSMLYETLEKKPFPKTGKF